MSLAATIFAYWKYRNEKRRLVIDEKKLLNEERVQKRADWKEKKHIYLASVNICKVKYMNGISEKEYERYVAACEEARTLFPDNIIRYLERIKHYARESIAARHELIGVNKKRMIKAENWLLKQVAENNKENRRRERMIDRKFGKYMGID